MIRPRKMFYFALDRIIRVARSLGAELKDTPFVVMAGRYKGDEARQGVAVGAGGICYGRPRCYDYCRSIRQWIRMGEVEEHELSSVT
jgi:hypothetical protein